MRVYKIMSAAHWQQLQQQGEWPGSVDDLRDGFVHLSTAEQVEGTLQRHFQGQSGLMLIGFELEALGAALRFEPSRGGALFPHLYGSLQLETVCSVISLGDRAS